MTNRTIIVSGRGHGKTHWMKELALAQQDPGQRERIQKAFEGFAAAAGVMVEAMTNAFASVSRALADANLVPPPVPEDPRERALFLAQRRGTGPEKVLDRRPRRG
jgi:phage-related baseplate assembly protein